MPTGHLMLGLALQIATGATVETVMPGLIANGERYAAALPSLTCEEAVTSRHLKGDKVKEEVTLNGTMQIQRTSEARRPFEEQYRWLTRNGENLAEGKKPKIPYFLSGAFVNGLGFADSRRTPCFDMTLDDRGATLILNLKRKPEADANADCAAVAPGRTSRVTIERATGHVTRLEANIPAKEAEQRKQPYYVAIDYQPVLLGEETFWLPVQVDSRNASDDLRMTATYANCRRFSGSMKIIGTPTVVPQ